MKVGSHVETVGDFEEEWKSWDLPYPNKGDVLTVSHIAPHPNKECNDAGIVLLSFEEKPSLPGLCDKKIDGEVNFVELRLPDAVAEALEVPEEELMEQ